MKKINYYIFEDERTSNFFPLSYLRPVYELRSGVFSLREKIEKILNIKNINLVTRPGLVPFLKEEYPGYNINQFFISDSIFINGRLIAEKNALKKISKNKENDILYVKNKELVAVFITKKSLEKFLIRWNRDVYPLFKDGDFNDFRVEEIDVRMISYPWDLIVNNGQEIENDFQIIKKDFPKNRISEKLHVINKKNILIGKDTIIYPSVVLDASNGPIVIGNKVTIMPQSTIIGPSYIGDQTIIKIGAKIYQNCSIGEVCKVGGELDSVIIQSYSNKQHDGYLGHAYVGSWANFGAGTNNSDLKNNYSPIKAMIDGKLVKTNLQHFGMLFGDHSKTGIGMIFDTGTVVGICCNLYGEGLPPRYIPSFVRGTPNTQLKTNSIEMVLETAKIVMQRRNKILTDTLAKLLREVFENTENQRKEFNIL